MCSAAGPPAPVRAAATASPPRYRARNPRATPLYQLLDAHYETVKLHWEERFEPRSGYWRGLTDGAVAKYLDCGIFANGFARVRCPTCPTEYLVALSCKCRGLCPSCGAKRATIFSELLHHRILADVSHAQWVFSIPKMLRLYFLHHRALLTDLARCAYDTVREMMAAAVDIPAARPGMVTVIQTVGAALHWHPHIHAIVSRGVWHDGGEWTPLPYVDPQQAELLFRHKVLHLLQQRGLLGDERIDLLLSWRHSGFAVHNHTTVYPQDTEGLHRLACYLLRPPVCLARLHLLADSNEVRYVPKPGHDRATAAVMDPLEFVARVITQIPQPRAHLVHYCGAYANRARAGARHRPTRDAATARPRRPAVRKRWAALIHRVYQIDPLTCPRCGATMRIVSVITAPHLVRRILDHLAHTAASSRAPPRGDTAAR
ncbi:MAG: transposase [Alphaproteobacteria bacterium]